MSIDNDIDIEQIRARAHSAYTPEQYDRLARTDVPALLAEVERLRANECTRQHLRVEDVERAEKAEADLARHKAFADKIKALPPSEHTRFTTCIPESRIRAALDEILGGE